MSIAKAVNIANKEIQPGIDRTKKEVDPFWQYKKRTQQNKCFEPVEITGQGKSRITDKITDFSNFLQTFREHTTNGSILLLKS